MLEAKRKKEENKDTEYIKIITGKVPLKIAICDDEKRYSEELRKIVGKINPDIEVKTYCSPTDFLEFIEKEEKIPNIIFLDIEMPEMDGITLAKKLKNMGYDSYVIFTTAHAEYAVKGYEARAFRYLLKPFSEEMISRVLLEISGELNKIKKILLQSSSTEEVIPLKDVIYISAEDKYTVLYTKDKYCLGRISLSNYEKMLIPYGFYRIHRKYIINFQHYKGMENGNVYLTNGKSVPISRRREKKFHKELLQYLEKELV